MRNFVSGRAREIPPSGIRKFFDLVLTMEGVISLGVGEPDFRTPWNICESSIYSIEQGTTSYTSNKGLHSLRVALSRYLAQHYNLTYSGDDEIIITSGVSEALDIAIRAIVDPGKSTYRTAKLCLVCPLRDTFRGKTCPGPVHGKGPFQTGPGYAGRTGHLQIKGADHQFPEQPDRSGHGKRGAQSGC